MRVRAQTYVEIKGNAAGADTTLQSEATRNNTPFNYTLMFCIPMSLKHTFQDPAI